MAVAYPYPKPFPGASYFAIAVASAVGGAALTSGETDALGIDFTYHSDRTKQMSVLDTGTPANAGDFDPFTKLTYTSPSIKLCRQSDGVYRYGNHNLGLRSQELDNASWGTKYQSSVSANATTAPDGTATADKLVESAANDAHGIEQAITGVAGKVYQWSVYAKPAGRSWFGTGVNFDVTNGVLGDIAAGFTASITSVGNGWYRCVWIGPAATSAIGFSFYLATSNSTFSYSGDGSSGIYFWGAQVKAYPVQEPSGLSGYMATTTAARYDLPYEWNAAGVSQGLLIEEARTNLLTRSQEISNAAWTTGGSTTITANATTAPDGTTTADRLNEDNGAANSYVYSPTATITTAATTWSVFLKGNSRQWIAVHAYDGANRTTYFDLTNGVVGTNAAGNTASIVDAGNGWWRCIITRTAGTTTGVLNIQAASADNTITAVGDNTKGYYIWGAQIETGSFATSPIHTIGATVSRAVDNLSLATSVFPTSTTGGTLFTEHVCLRTETNSYHYPIAFNDDSGSDLEWAGLGYDTGERIFMDVYHNNANTGFIDTGDSLIQGQNRKVAGAWATNDFAVSVDGAAADTTNAAGGGAGPDEFSSLTFSGTGFYYKKFAYLPRRATNTELQTRTA
jgi:hypothetical protein